MEFNPPCFLAPLVQFSIPVLQSTHSPVLQVPWLTANPVLLEFPKLDDSFDDTVEIIAIPVETFGSGIMAKSYQ